MEIAWVACFVVIIFDCGIFLRYTNILTSILWGAFEKCWSALFREDSLYHSSILMNPLLCLKRVDEIFDDDTAVDY